MGSFQTSRRSMHLKWVVPPAASDVSFADALNRPCCHTLVGVRQHRTSRKCFIRHVRRGGDDLLGGLRRCRKRIDEKILGRLHWHHRRSPTLAGQVAHLGRPQYLTCHLEWSGRVDTPASDESWAVERRLESFEVFIRIGYGGRREPARN